MKDLTDYFTTPRKVERVVPQNTNSKSLSPKPNKQLNGSHQKIRDKRKLEPDNDVDDAKVKSKFGLPNSSSFPKVSSKFRGNLTVVLTQIDMDLPKKVTPEKKEGVRIFKNVLLKDFKKSNDGMKLDSEIPSETKSTKKSKIKRKRIRVGDTDSSDAEKSDSSAKLFKECTKQAKSAITSNRRSDGNNLFNYFSKAEKKPVTVIDDNDSPMKCHRVVKVEALIHSPPKARRSLISGANSEVKLQKTFPCIDNVRLPVVKIVRADYAKFNALDEIIELGSDFVDTTIIKKSRGEFASSDKDSDSSSDDFQPPKIQPWKMRVKFVSHAKLRPRRKKSESKEKKTRETSNDEAEKKSVASSDQIVQKTPEKIAKQFETPSEIRASIDEEKPVIKKLAPLFCRPPVSKKVPPNPVDTEARRLFLESGVPENIKKKMEEQKNSAIEESVYREYRFPVRTHVQQAESTNWVWNLREVTNFSLKSIDDEVVVPSFNCIVSLASCRKPVETGSGERKFCTVEEIAALERQEPSVNVGDVFATVKKLNKNMNNENGTLCWTEKYKPSTYLDVIGNSTNLVMLKEWIESHKRIRIRLSEAEEGSSEDFIDSDDSSCCADTRNNVALLVGPPGCGKTCAVYTLANELGFKVLEVNAASNRNGKRITDELHEATQSHRVKRTSVFDKDMKKSKKKKKDSNHEKKTMTLILIEDADILFENYDEGFLSALSSLTLHSKRPFIFTLNSLNHAHLTKYTAGQTLVLKFAYPSVSLLHVWLRSIAFNEGVTLSDEVLMYLFHVAGLDLRKSLLQLQMLISSNKCHFTLSNEQLFYTNWWKLIIKMGNLNKSMCKITESTSTSKKLFSDDEDEDYYKIEGALSDNQCNQCEKTTCVKSKSERNADIKALKQLASLFERIACLGNFASANSDNSVAFPCQETFLKESSVSFYHSELSNDIANTIKNEIFKDSCYADSSFLFKDYYEKIRIKEDIKQIVDNVFCHFNPKLSNTVSKYCDYLPTIRNIARIESNKVPSQRRASRYFSYLNSINISVSENETNFLSNSLS